MTFGQRPDTLIVGAGPAGCVLAARFTEQPERQVLLIDAGPDYGADIAAWPSELLDATRLEPDSHSWDFYQIPNGAGRRLQLPRGRVFGGSTAVNGAMWIRGSRRDYEEWARLGNAGWDFERLLPCFRRAEHDLDGPADLHGGAGPVTIARAAGEQLSAADRAFIESADELGFDWVDDINGQEAQGPCAGSTPKNLTGGKRLNAALSYLALARERPNLTLLADHLVDKVLIEDGQAIGILTADGQRIEADQIVLCAGAYGSPAILLRSGIGPADHLAELGIPVVRDLPGVGQRLLDHPQIARQSGLTTFFLKPGYEPPAPTFINVMLKARSRLSPEEIDLHLYPGEAIDPDTGRWTLAFGVSLQYARSEGEVRLTAADPTAELTIDHRHLSDPADMEAICDGYELLQRLVETPPLSRLLDGRLREGPHLHDREALQEIARVEVGTTYHPSSSCRMGPASDLLAVVDERCRVRGVDGLHIVDASIFPTSPRANLHFTVCAAAERAAELLR